MKHSLQTLRAALLLLVLMLMASNALAQKPYTYSPSGSVTMLTGGGNQVVRYVSIKNMTNTNLKLHLSYQGDSNITFGYAPYSVFTLGPDSGASFPIYYRGWAGDTSRGFFRIYDSVYAPDTIRYTAVDTGEIAIPWEISNNRVSWAGAYYSRPDTVWVPITNNQNDSVYISASILTGSYGFTGVGSQAKSIAANSTTTFAYLFNSGSFATAEATVQFSGAGITDTAKIHGRGVGNNNWSDTLTVQSYLDFGSINAGDTLCKTLTIYNNEDTVAVVTSLNMLLNSGYYFSDLPAMPVAIEAHDSMTVTICFVAPQESGSNANSYMNIYYMFGNTEKSLTVSLRGSSTSCFASSVDFINFGTLLHDESETRSFYLTNNRNVSTEVALSLNGGNGFTIMTSSPVTIPANDTAQVEVRFTASGNGSAAKLVMDGADNCGQVEVTLFGYVDDSTIVADSNSIALYGDQQRMLNFEGDSTDLSTRYVFYNDQTDTITVKSVSLRQGVHCSISDILPTYPEFRIATGAAFAVDVLFNGDPGTYGDTLEIVTETGFIALSFPIHAVVHGTAGVKPSTASVASMIVSPNPSIGPVAIAISDARTATIEVLDIMGTRIARFDGVNATFDRSNLASGTYFVRATGADLDQKPFVITTRIVLK